MKALVIGLDGATFAVLKPLMQLGYMPHLQKAIARGVSGKLLSTIPPVTATAWPTFMTGKNPGKHGVLSWQGRLNAQFKRPWINGSRIVGLKLWQLASEAGLRVCVVNVPMTYPPEPLNGVMITGMLTPSLESEFTYPPEIRRALLRTIPDYQIDLDVQRIQLNTRNRSAVQRFLDKAIIITKARGKAIRWLLRQERPDLVTVVFEMPDRLQHILWRYIVEILSPSDFKDIIAIRQKLLNCYQVLDEEIGSLIDDLPNDAYLIILSDHGFGPWDTSVHIDEWLAQHGWLAYNFRRFKSREILGRLGRQVKSWLPGSLKWKAQRAFPLLSTIEWKRTWAYPGLPTEYGIFLNVYGREPAGIVKPSDYEKLRTEIIEALREWFDPRTGTPIIKAVYRREEIYTGPFVAQAPDIIFEFQRGYRMSDLPSYGNLLSDLSHEPWGFHEREGILVMSGPGIKAGVEFEQAHIQDVMPTLLYALGVPIPDDLDGRVLLEFFDLMWRDKHYLHTRSSEIKTGLKTTRTYSIKDEMVVIKRLKNLGYLG